MELRFHLLNSHNDSFEFLYDVFELKDICKNKLLAHCKNLKKVLTDGGSSDLNALELADEINIVSSLLKKKQGPIDVLQFIISLNIGPNLSIAIRILLILPITVATGERPFSKLKIIKNYLTTMSTQNRINELAMLAIEHELSNKLDLKEIIRDFTE